MLLTMFRLLLTSFLRNRTAITSLNTREMYNVLYNALYNAHVLYKVISIVARPLRPFLKLADKVYECNRYSTRSEESG